MFFRVVLRNASLKGVVIIAVACGAFCINASAQGRLQTAESDTLYTVSYTDASLDAVLTELAEVTGIDLVYNPDLTQGRRIIFEMTDGTAEQILAKVVDQAGLQIRQLDTGTYVITRPTAERPPPPPPPAVLQGSVADSDTGKPLDNVRIISAGRLPVVFTDSAGIFRYNGVPVGQHLLVAVKEGYSIAFTWEDAVPGETTDVSILLQPETIPVEIPDTTVKSNLPVYHSVITGVYNQDSVVFPEWNGTGHDAWLATLPGIITLKPVTGYHGLSYWSTENAGSAQGLFLFAGQFPDFLNRSGSIDPGSSWSSGFTNENRPNLAAEIRLSETFLEGGITSGHLPLPGGILKADVSIRMINPITSGSSRMIDDLKDWLYSDTNSGLIKTGGDDRYTDMDAGLMESGFNLVYSGSEQLAVGLRVNTGMSNLNMNGTAGAYLLYPVSETFDSRFAEVSQFIRYDAGGRDVFWQAFHTGHSRFIHQESANFGAQRFYGRYSRNEFGFEAGYIRAHSERTTMRTRYNFDSGTYDADFDSEWFSAVTGDKNRVADHRIKADVTFSMVSGRVLIRPGIGIVMSNMAGSPVFDPGIALEYIHPGYPGRGVHIQAGWHQQSQYRHRFRLPVPLGSSPVPFYDITMASGTSAEPVVVNSSYFDIIHSLNEMAKIRIFARYGIRKNAQSPDLIGEINEIPHAINERMYLTDFREFRIGGVLYGYSTRAGLEAALTYSYGNHTGKSVDRFNGERVQAAGNVPHQVQTSAQWTIGRDMKVEMLWESRFGIMERALHEKYYQFSQATGGMLIAGTAPAPGENRLESWHRLDAGLVKEQRIAGVAFTIRLQFMNILNRRNHLDTVVMYDISLPEPRYVYHKRRMPGFYPQFSLKAAF
jgi:hypothetical protein